MRSPDRQTIERSEVEAVLKSGILERAPAMSQILAYVCELHFAGRAGEIKEYNIAVDGLGRPAGFNPKQDSIVRVEAHRLRKRLDDYYAGQGSEHPVRIVIPAGQYVPRFVHREGDLQPVPAAPPPPPPRPAPRRSPALSVAAGLLLCAGVAWLFWSRYSHAERLPSVSAVSPPGPQIRIAAGAEMYVDGIGHVWQPDRYATGGISAMLAVPARNTRDPQLYASYREGGFRYDIPLPPGVYELRLHFLEPLFGREGGIPGGEGSRLIQVSMNGVRALQSFDIFAEAGTLSPDVKVFKDVSPAPDGKLHLEFSGTGRGAVLSAIEITPGIPGVMMPIRMVSRDTPYTDKQGLTWYPDQYVSGGRLVFRTAQIRAAEDAELYRGERYGSLIYRIPVPPGRYVVILHFCETWFGPDHAGGGGRGERLFDILCNGAFLERNLDVFREAGGSDRGLRRVYRNIEPNSQRMIVLSLNPRINYAELNALEVWDAAQ